ncbi:MAG: methyltransferase domain-containing protein [Nitrospinae bacterium]|nr:methyltransferase domain-containing protein [Nitrospinota bacterium]
MDETELKRKICDSFNAVAEGYDNPALRFFQKSAQLLPGYLSLKGDESVLDVATGTGHAAMALAGALPRGRVTGIDFSQGMLERARAKIAGESISNIYLIPMDMQYIDLPNESFDAAVFSFSIFFVEDMERQLRHVMEKVKPGGKILFTSFQKSSFSPIAEMFFDRVKKYGVETPQSWQKLATAEECETLMAKAGLGSINVGANNVGYHLTGAGQWWDLVWNAGFRRFVNAIPPERLGNFRREHMEEVESLKSAEGIWLAVNALYAVGRKI